jgi:hypothetical protein
LEQYLVQAENHIDGTRKRIDQQTRMVEQIKADGRDSAMAARGHTMKNHGMMPVAANTSTMWTLNQDRKTVRFSLPPLRVGSMPEPLMVFMDLDAGTVDEIVDRLTVLRAQMVPAPPKPASRN